MGFRAGAAGKNRGECETGRAHGYTSEKSQIKKRIGTLRLTVVGQFFLLRYKIYNTLLIAEWCDADEGSIFHGRHIFAPDADENMPVCSGIAPQTDLPDASGSSVTIRTCSLA
jgi:hypothetical protein